MHRIRLALLSLLVVGASASAGAVSPGQIDDFQDGTTQSWTSGGINPNPPTNIPDAGPKGLGDRALRIVATGGFGAGARLTAFNRSQWTGDYLANGIDRIEIQVNNTGTTLLQLRLALNSSAMTQPGLWFSTTTSIALPPASGWKTVEFSIAPQDLTPITGIDADDTLSAVTELRLLHAAQPAFQGDPVAARLFIDNVSASVPSAVPAVPVFGLLVLEFIIIFAGLRILTGRSSANRVSVAFGSPSLQSPQACDPTRGWLGRGRSRPRRAAPSGS